MLLKGLFDASSPSGYEGEVRNVIRKSIEKLVDEIKIDKMGNIIAHKSGRGPKIALYTNIDESGFIITGYNNDGTLKFSPLGKIDSKIIPSKLVYIGKDKIPGVIGIKPIHLQNKKEREENISFSECCIDIGLSSKDEAKALIKLGDYAVFSTEFEEFGENLIKGKAFNNRIGCNLLIDILKEKYKCDLYGVFNVQEKVGQRGAYVSTFNIKPDICIILNACIADDIPGVAAHSQISKLGGGTAISIIDKNLRFNGSVTSELVKIAEENKIKYQYKVCSTSENEAIAIEMTENGVEIAVISIPCRYMNSSISICSIDDYEKTGELIKRYLKSYN